MLRPRAPCTQHTAQIGPQPLLSLQMLRSVKKFLEGGKGVKERRFQNDQDPAKIPLVYSILDVCVQVPIPQLSRHAPRRPLAQNIGIYRVILYLVRKSQVHTYPSQCLSYVVPILCILTHRVEERAIPFARLNNVEVLFILLPLLRKNAPERMFALSLKNRFYC